MYVHIITSIIVPIILKLASTRRLGIVSLFDVYSSTCYTLVTGVTVTCVGSYTNVSKHIVLFSKVIQPSASLSLDLVHMVCSTILFVYVVVMSINYQLLTY